MPRKANQIVGGAMSKKKCKSDRTKVPRKDELLRHLSDVRRFVMKTTDDPTLLRYLDEIKKALVETKYGLIFEEHTEEIERILTENRCRAGGAERNWQLSMVRG